MAKELHKLIIKNFKTRKIYINGIDHIWAADLLILSNFSKVNKGYKYVLVMINCFSEYVWCVALKKKDAATVTNAFEQILTNSKRKPQLLRTDMGKEFVNSQFNKLLERNHVKLYHTYSEVKSTIVKRFNRTLNDKFRLYFWMNKNHKWLWILSDILKDYNEKHVHRTISVPPAMVSKENEQEIHQRMYGSHFKFEKPTFKEGDRVRITRKNSTFSNKYERKWTTEIFIIRKIRYTEPIIYSIKDLDGEEINGKFYKQELQKIKF